MTMARLNAPVNKSDYDELKTLLWESDKITISSWIRQQIRTKIKMAKEKTVGQIPPPDPLQNVDITGAVVETTGPETKDNTKLVLKALVDKLDTIANDVDFKQVWKVYYQTGNRYRGPTWADELAAAKKALE